MSGRKLGYVLSSLFVSFTVSFSLAACTAATGEATDEDNAEVASGQKNLCVGQAANTFHCIDDTRFELCTGSDHFVVNSCPKGLCATRHPAIKNPCVGADRATEIDGVPPTPPNQIDDTPGGNAPPANTTPPPANTTPPPANTTPPPANNPPANNGGGNNGAACVGGPKFDPAGVKNVGNGRGGQFIGGQCLSAADCASGCCALPCGICSGVGAQFQAGKQGCGFVSR